VAQHLHRIEVVERRIAELIKFAAAQMQEPQAAVVWLVEVPGIGPEGA
jgi:hypothetical protein